MCKEVGLDRQSFFYQVKEDIKNSQVIIKKLKDLVRGTKKTVDKKTTIMIDVNSILGYRNKLKEVTKEEHKEQLNKTLRDIDLFLDNFKKGKPVLESLQELSWVVEGISKTEQKQISQKPSQDNIKKDTLKNKPNKPISL